MALPGAPSSGVTKHLSLPGPAPCSPLEPLLPCMDGCSCFPLPGKAISARCPCQARAWPPQAPGPVGSSPWSTAQRTLLLSSLHLCGHHSWICKVPPDTSRCPHIPRPLTTGDSGCSCRTQPHPGPILSRPPKWPVPDAAVPRAGAGNVCCRMSSRARGCVTPDKPLGQLGGQCGPDCSSVWRVRGLGPRSGHCPVPTPPTLGAPPSLDTESLAGEQGSGHMHTDG